MTCPRCNSSTYKKNGIVFGRQHYKCSDCGYNYTVELKSTAFPFCKDTGFAILS